MSHSAKTITCRAAVLWAPNDLKVETVEVAPPKGREIRVKILYNALCHSDLFVIEGKLPGVYPCIVGHEAVGIVESIGEDVTWFKPGDHVIPTFMPCCQNCRNCQRGDNNFCEKLQFENFYAPLDDGTTRITCKGQAVTNFLGTTCFSEYSVMMDRHAAKINPDVPLDRVCLLGCGFTTGYGSAVNTAEVKKGERVAVFGAGAVGLSAIHGAHKAEASEIFAIDINPAKKELAKTMGATVFVNPAECPEKTEFVPWFVEKYGKVDKSIECIGNLQCMKNAIHITERGWGRTVIVGLGPIDQELGIHPFTFLQRKTVLGACYGDVKLREIPELAEKVKNGEISVDPLITHRFDLEDVSVAVELLKKAKTIRSVISLSKA